MPFFECMVSACGVENCPSQEVGTQCATGFRTRGESNITADNALVKTTEEDNIGSVRSKDGLERVLSSLPKMRHPF